MKWLQLDPDEAFGMVWIARRGPFVLQVYGDEATWSYTVARHRIIVRCVANAAATADKGKELAQEAFAEFQLASSSLGGSV